VKKIRAFSEVEMLRAAKRVVDFKATHPTASVNSSVHAEFIKNNAAGIEAEKKIVWPRATKKIVPWSELDLCGRAKH